MANHEIAFQLMRLYHTLRGPGDVKIKDAARREIDRLLREFESRASRSAPFGGPLSGESRLDGRRLGG